MDGDLFISVQSADWMDFDWRHHFNALDHAAECGFCGWNGYSIIYLFGA